jgi:diaminobutyrate-2-oxoglutarate transaminase
MALTLFKPEYDVWAVGEHNGTFRGQNPSFVTGKAALDRFWSDDVFAKDTVDKGNQLRDGLVAIADKTEDAQVRGRGLLQGIAYTDYNVAGAVAKAAFERGLLVETSGPESEVVKLMPALTIDTNDLARGIGVLSESVDAVFGNRGRKS